MAGALVFSWCFSLWYDVILFVSLLSNGLQNTRPFIKSWGSSNSIWLFCYLISNKFHTYLIQEKENYSLYVFISQFWRILIVVELKVIHISLVCGGNSNGCNFHKIISWHDLFSGCIFFQPSLSKITCIFNHSKTIVKEVKETTQRKKEKKKRLWFLK